MYCPNCGMQSPDDVSFCGYCGAALRVIPPSTGSMPTSMQYPDQHPEQNQGFTQSQERYAQDRSAAVPPGYGPMPPGPKKVRNTMIIAVVILAFVLILAAVLIGLNLHGQSNSGDIPGIANGQYLLFHATIVTPAQNFTGTLRIDISNVKATNFTMTYTYSIGGINQVTQQVENYSGGDWSTASFSDSNSSDNTSMTSVGQEQISTVYGNEMADHYSANYSGYTYDAWSGANGCPYELKFTYTDGMVVTCVLQNTNIQDFKT